MAHEDERSIRRSPRRHSEMTSIYDVRELILKSELLVGKPIGLAWYLIDSLRNARSRVRNAVTTVLPGVTFPEEARYLLSSRQPYRLIMVSNRPEGQGSYGISGLFAEVVELDKTGNNPEFSLTSEVDPLSSEGYYDVDVGPNSFKLPPSRIPFVEETDEISGEKRLVPWETWRDQLRMGFVDQIVVNPEEDLRSFLDRLKTLEQRRIKRAQEVIRKAFPFHEKQSFYSDELPINIIVTNGKREVMEEASRQVGLYPLVITPEEMDSIFSAENLRINRPNDTHELTQRQAALTENKTVWDVYTLIGRRSGSPAVVTFDERPEGMRESERQAFSFPNREMFAVVRLRDEPDKSNAKGARGLYYSYSEEDYAGLLRKLKADLFLTKFIRGQSLIAR